MEKVREGQSRARFTLAHELGHYFLGHKGTHRRNADKNVYAGPRERTEEQEANTFASYFLVPTELARNAKGPDDIASWFQVSAEAAEIAFERVQRESRRASGKRRVSPTVVIDFLKEAKRLGYEVRSDISGEP